MENKKELETLASGFANIKSNDNDWWYPLAMTMLLFGNSGFSGKKPEHDTETRLSKLEAKTDLLEKIILK